MWSYITQNIGKTLFQKNLSTDVPKKIEQIPFKCVQGSTFKVNEHATQPAFTCSKLTMETLEQGVKYIQS